MKIRTVEQLSDRLDEDFIWRLIETSHFIAAAHGGGIERESLIRGGVTILYSHWEGFIKEGSLLYLNHIQSNKFKYKELEFNFLAIKVMSDIELCYISKQISPSIEFLEKFHSLQNERMSFSKEVIDARSNLSSDAFKNILKVIGLDPTPYETKFNFLDSKLLSTRNCIAHGERSKHTFDEFKLMTDEVFAMLRDFKARLVDVAARKDYIREVQS